MKIAYLGPEGSYTHIAALGVFSKNEGDENQELIATKTITDVVEDLENAKVDKAIVPIENSIAGSVNETTDALLRSKNIYVNQEYTLNIDHCLLCSEETELSDLKNVHAHTMSFGQCRDFLRENCPNAALELSSSNSRAAAKVAEIRQAQHAAIAPELCAKLYDLKVIAKSINDEGNNKTRFWILSRSAAAPSQKDKTSIVFQTADEPGSLMRILEAFSEAKINLTRLESRPARRNLGEYSFCVDLEGHQENDNLAAALKNVQRYFTYYKCLGSYRIETA